MQKASQNKKLIKLMSGVLAILTISSPTSLATKPIQLEDKPGILEKFKSFAWPAAIIGGAIIVYLLVFHLIFSALFKVANPSFPWSFG